MLSVEKIYESVSIQKLSKDIDKALSDNDPDMSYKDFALAVADIMKTSYGDHNYKQFLDILKKELK